MINNVVLLFSATNEETPYEQLLQHWFLYTENFQIVSGCHFFLLENDMWAQGSLGEQTLINYRFQEIVPKQFRI